MSDSYKEEKRRLGVDEKVIDDLSPSSEKVDQRMRAMQEYARRIKNNSAPKSEKGKSPYLDTQLLQQDLVKKYERKRPERKSEKDT